MKKIVWILMAIIAAMPMMAQNEAGTWTFIPKVGFNSSTTSNPDIYTTESMNSKLKPKSVRGLVVGCEAEYQHTDILSYTVGLFYSQQGFAFNHEAGIDDYEVSLDYLNMPLLLNAYVATGLAVKSGVQLGVAVRKHGSDQSADYSGETTGFRDFDVSIPIGVSYTVGPWQLDARYNLGLNYIHKLGSTLPYRNRVWQFTLGYRL